VATVSVGIAIGNPKYDHPEDIVHDVARPCTQRLPIAFAGRSSGFALLESMKSVVEQPNGQRSVGRTASAKPYAQRSSMRKSSTIVSNVVTVGRHRSYTFRTMTARCSPTRCKCLEVTLSL
jgi:hypothetical protein